MKLVVAWTLIGAFVFTVVITCLSLVGLLKFKDRAQQKKLFYVMIVQLAIGCVGFFRGVLQPNTKITEQKIEAPLQQQKKQLQEKNTDLTTEKQQLLTAIQAIENKANKDSVTKDQTIEELKQELTQLKYEFSKSKAGELAEQLDDERYLSQTLLDSIKRLLITLGVTPRFQTSVEKKLFEGESKFEAGSEQDRKYLAHELEKISRAISDDKTNFGNYKRSALLVINNLNLSSKTKQELMKLIYSTNSQEVVTTTLERAFKEATPVSQ